MTSEERRAARRQRREAERERKKRLFDNCMNFETVFSYGHLYRAYRKCRCGVAWKASTQKYIANAPLNVYRTHTKLMNGTFRSGGFTEFELHERGKTRHIRSVTITERVVQRTMCDYALTPVLGRSFIHDNGASRTGKGYSFAVRKITQHLREHCRKHGRDGYILLFDFSKFFDRISHRLAKDILKRGFTDPRLLKLADHFIDAFGERGLGLGSQISQSLALASANPLDHYIKEVLRIRGYGRYMDDGYLIHHSKRYLRFCLARIREICRKLEITLNEKKTQIIKLSHGFTWIKVRFFVTTTGRILRKIHHSSVTRMRRKLKKYAVLVKAGRMQAADAYASFQSWKSYANKFNAYKTGQSMAALYDRLFI